MAKKSGKIIVRLKSTAGTGYYKTTTKQARAPKLKKRCYDPVVRKHVDFEEGKI